MREPLIELAISFYLALQVDLIAKKLHLKVTKKKNECLMGMIDTALFQFSSGVSSQDPPKE